MFGFYVLCKHTFLALATLNIIIIIVKVWFSVYETVFFSPFSPIHRRRRRENRVRLLRFSIPCGLVQQRRHGRHDASLLYYTHTLCGRFIIRNISFQLSAVVVRKAYRGADAQHKPHLH